MSGHPGSEENLLSLKRFFYWPGMYKWVRTLTKSCLTCRKNKQTRKDQNTAPNEKWGEELSYPFHTVHNDHKGPLNPMSEGKRRCLVVLDAFSRFIQVYPVKLTDATHTIEVMSIFITSFGILQKLVYDQGTSFMVKDFSTFFLEFGITHAPRTKWAPWTNVKVEIQNKRLSRHFRCYLSEAGNNWAKLARQFAFAHNTAVNSSTGTTPYEIVFGFKPQIPIFLKLGLVRDDNDLCQSEFCQYLPNHTHVNEVVHASTIYYSRKARLSCSTAKLNSRIYIAKCIGKSEKPIIVLCPTETSTNLPNHYELDKKFSWKITMFHSENLKNFCELRSGPYIVTKVITKANYEIALEADQTRTQVVHRNHLVDYFPRDNELPNLLSNYEKPFNDEKTERFYNENAKCRLFQLNQPINSFVEREHLNDYLPIFLDTCGPSRMDTTIKSPVKNNSCHPTPNLLASSPDSGIPQSFPHTPLSFQSESPVITSQPTTPSPLPRTSNINPTNLQSTSTDTTPRSRNAGTLRNIPREWYGKPYF